MRRDRHDEVNHAQKLILILILTLDTFPSFSLFKNLIYIYIFFFFFIFFLQNKGLYFPADTHNGKPISKSSNLLLQSSSPCPCSWDVTAQPPSEYKASWVTQQANEEYGRGYDIAPQQQQQQIFRTKW
jgi:hypothetical protein